MYPRLLMSPTSGAHYTRGLQYQLRHKIFSCVGIPSESNYLESVIIMEDAKYMTFELYLFNFIVIWGTLFSA